MDIKEWIATTDEENLDGLIEVLKKEKEIRKLMKELEELGFPYNRSGSNK